MGKDRNTMAKRQREVEKRQKAVDKRDKRTYRKNNPDGTPDLSSREEAKLSPSEINVLSIFRKYLMTPGQMLCLNNADLISMKTPLEKLVASRLLVPEASKGGYSLSRDGFEAMVEHVQEEK